MMKYFGALLAISLRAELLLGITPTPCTVPKNETIKDKGKDIGDMICEEKSKKCYFFSNKLVHISYYDARKKCHGLKTHGWGEYSTPEDSDTDFIELVNKTRKNIHRYWFGNPKCSLFEEQETKQMVCDQTTLNINVICVKVACPPEECPDGKFGPDCKSVCHCLDENEACNKDHGICMTGCARGFQGDNCQEECEDGKFGRVCLRTCNCKKRSEVCDKVTGKCTSGCPDGITREDCQEDPPAWPIFVYLDDEL